MFLALHRISHPGAGVSPPPGMEARRLLARIWLPVLGSTSTTMRRLVRTSTRRTAAVVNISSEIQTVDTQVDKSIATYGGAQAARRPEHLLQRDRPRRCTVAAKTPLPLLSRAAPRCCVLDCCRCSIERASNKVPQSARSGERIPQRSTLVLQSHLCASRPEVDPDFLAAVNGLVRMLS